MKNSNDEIIDLEEDIIPSEEIEDDNLESENIQKSQPTQILDEGSSQVLQKMGVSKAFSNKTIKNGGGSLSPSKGNPLIKNTTHDNINKLANDSKNIQQVLNKNNDISKISNKGTNEEDNNLESENIQKSQPTQILDEGGSQVLQKMGVPKPFANKAIKNGGGSLSPSKGNPLIKNTTRNNINKLANQGNDSKKIQQVLNKNNNIPKIANKGTNEEDNNKQSLKDKATTMAGATALTAATGGALNGKTAMAVSSLLVDKQKKIKTVIIIATISIVSLLFIIILGISGGSDDLGINTNGYITGEMTEDELLNELEYYGYCKNKTSCKKQGSYKFFEKLKSTYESYNQACSGTNNKPCSISINTALIIETINYYDNATDNFDTYDSSEEEMNNNIFQSIFNNIKKAIEQKKSLDDMIDDVDKLALAQVEYVKETCGQNKQVNYYYQLSFDKYISYLKYGDSSSHPNYQGKPVEIENEVCQGPTNDYIETSYSENNSSLITDSTNNYTITGSGKGVDIANYALQFVGNPYVYGGTNLISGVDCSGFTMKVMEHFGISIPHSSAEQINYGTNIGTNVSQALPGDLIIYNGHVAIYLGNNSIVHASSPKSGIKISNNASYRSIVGIVRLWE